MKEKIEVKNAKITGARLLIEDHGILTIFLDLDYGGSGQSFGGYALHISSKKNYGRDVGGFFIWRILETVGVWDWNDLTGKTIRVKAAYDKVHAIGNIIEDRWFDPQKEFAVRYPE